MKVMVLAALIGILIPLQTQDPQQPNIEEMVLIQGNTLRAISVPMFPYKFHSYGVLGADPEYSLILQYKGWNADIAYAIMKAESGGNPDAINWQDKHRTCTGSFGLFQLACFRGTKEELLDPDINVRIAYHLYLEKGWKPWSVYLNKSYLAFLK